MSVHPATDSFWLLLPGPPSPRVDGEPVSILAPRTLRPARRRRRSWCRHRRSWDPAAAPPRDRTRRSAATARPLPKVRHRNTTAHHSRVLMLVSPGRRTAASRHRRRRFARILKRSLQRRARAFTKSTFPDQSPALFPYAHDLASPAGQDRKSRSIEGVYGDREPTSDSMARRTGGVSPRSWGEIPARPSHA